MTYTLSNQTSATDFKTSLARTTRAVILTLMALFAALTFQSTVTPTAAEAGIGKKVKLAGKAFRKVEKVGRKLSRKKGIVGKIGKGMKKVGRSGRKGTGKLRKGIRIVKKAGKRQLAKSKVGRGVLRAGKTVKRVRKNSLNRAFRKCKTNFCNNAKEAADAYIPG